MYKNIESKDAFELFNKEEVTILDVRLREDFEKEKIKNSINIFFGEYDFEEQVDELEKEKPCLVYCKVGVGSLRAIGLMEDLGFGKIYNLIGGIDKWKEDGYEVE